jgi:glycosyltransferase involved in cell wall biosynthesis
MSPDISSPEGKSGMRVLAIGTDRRLFTEGSAVLERQRAYARKIGDLDILVFTRGGFEKKSVGQVTVVPTNSRSKFFYGLDAWRVAKTLQRPNVITAQDPFETGLVGLFVARRLKVPLHVQVHTDFTSKEFSRHSLMNWLRVRIAWFVLKRASRIRVILNRTAADIRMRGVTAPITVLPIFVDSARFAALPRTKHPKWKIALLSIGRFEKEKRFTLAIEALALARSHGHDVGLTLVGDGSERSVYYRYAQRLRVADRLEIAGWQDDLSKFYAEADIVLVTSRYEGYGLVIVEALASGVPVLSTDVGVAREAGAMVTSAREFPNTLLKWIADGPRKATLATTPYSSLEDYVARYSEDIQATH